MVDRRVFVRPAWDRKGPCATVRPTSLGLMLVAGTERGVCAVLFGEDEAELAADLRGRFPRARFVDAPSGFESWVAAVAAYVEMPRGVLG